MTRAPPRGVTLVGDRRIGGEYSGMIGVGELAPDFTLMTTKGQSLRLRDFHGRQRLLLLFYPRELTGG